MNLQKRFALFDEFAHELIAGIGPIAAAAGYGPEYFLRRYLDVPASEQVVSSGVVSCHTGLGHYYRVEGGYVTHPGSAAAWGQNARELIRQTQQVRTPGWRGSKACSASAGSVIT